MVFPQRNSVKRRCQYGTPETFLFNYDVCHHNAYFAVLYSNVVASLLNRLFTK